MSVIGNFVRLGEAAALIEIAKETIYYNKVEFETTSNYTVR